MVTGGASFGAEPRNGDAVAPAEAAARLRSAPANLALFSAQLGGLEREWQAAFTGLAEKKYSQVSTAETDALERLLFRFLGCRESLWDMVTFFADYERNFTTESDQTRALATGFHAAALLARHTAWLVQNGMENAVAVRKLNEAHYTYDIPSGTFDMLFYALTSPKHLADLRGAQRFFAAEATRPESELNRIMQADPPFAAELAQTAWLWLQADQMTEMVLKRKSIVLPAAANWMRQNELAEQSRKLAKTIGANLYVAQGLLFNTVSDFKRPQTHHTVFSPEQVAEIKAALEPGDLLMTYSAGYMSNVFLPGKFKHGITYVGAPAQRAALDLGAAQGDVPEAKRARLTEDLAAERLPSGADADVIEAVAEGVIRNSLASLLHNHINRMVVLRPRLGEADRRGALVNTFLLLGCQYDFNFDFVDSSYQCCTEVIYRSLDRRGGIAFTLVPRSGVQTLAADDIINQHLRSSQSPFDLVLLAEEMPDSTAHAARILKGDEGAQRLAALMAEPPLKLPTITLPNFKAALPDLLPGKGN
jgi:hypothetical protein